MNIYKGNPFGNFLLYLAGMGIQNAGYPIKMKPALCYSVSDVK